MTIWNDFQEVLLGEKTKYKRACIVCRLLYQEEGKTYRLSAVDGLHSRLT